MEMAENLSVIVEDDSDIDLIQGDERRTISAGRAREKAREGKPEKAPDPVDPFERIRTSVYLPDNIVAVIPLVGKATLKLLEMVIESVSRKGVQSGNVVINNARELDLDLARDLLDLNKGHASHFDIHFSNKDTLSG